MSLSTLLDRFARPTGRVLIGLFYIVNGIGLTKDHSPVLALMVGKDVPAPTVLLTVTIVLWFLAGACLVLGYQVRMAALVLFAFTIPVTAFIHNFWAAPPESFQNELAHFLKNTAILGGLLHIAGDAGSSARVYARS